MIAAQRADYFFYWQFNSQHPNGSLSSQKALSELHKMQCKKILLACFTRSLPLAMSHQRRTWEEHFCSVLKIHRLPSSWGLHSSLHSDMDMALSMHVPTASQYYISAHTTH